MTAAVTAILEAAGVAIHWQRYDAGLPALEKYGTPLPEPLIKSIAKNKVALKGPVTTPVGEGFTSVNVGLRKALNLYANLRPVKNLPHVRSRFEHVDLVIVRENTEDLYSGIEHEVVPGVVESLKIITEAASTRIARFAFDYARRRGRKHITAIHKANIMKMADGLFIRSAEAVAAEYPDIAYDEQIIDAACMNLVMKPERFDVLLLPNLYGDIVSDLCAGADAGVFEAVHGSAPDIAGKNIANPTALLRSALLMLDHLGEQRAAARIEAALFAVIADPSRTTRDLGGTASTTEFAEAICRQLRSGSGIRASTKSPGAARRSSKQVRERRPRESRS